jgi:hypothetical protein
VATQIQPDWQKIARDKFPGFTVRGLGPFAVADSTMMVVELFSHLLLANITGRKVHQLSPPQTQPTLRRRIIHIDD